MPVTRSKASIVSSVIVPAYKENLNIRPLTERLFKALEEQGEQKRAVRFPLVGGGQGSRPRMRMRAAVSVGFLPSCHSRMRLFFLYVPCHPPLPSYPTSPRAPSSRCLATGMRDETELVIVDDNSNDGSEETVKTLQGEGFPVRIIVRKKERGLSSAVLRGMQEGLGSRLVCMDGRALSPPPSFPDATARPLLHPRIRTASLSDLLSGADGERRGAMGRGVDGRRGC
jgi:hypothetical protein